MRKLVLSTIVALAFAGAANAATFAGEFWNATSSVTNLTTASSVMSSRAADATFTSTVIDYPNGSGNTTQSNRTLSAFLGTDAGSLVGDGSVNLAYSVFRWTGFLDLTAGDHTFAVGSDDGFRLTVGGQTMQFDGVRGFRRTTQTLTMAGGLTAVELIFFENSGNTGVDFLVDGSLAAPAAAVPLPATAALSLAGLAALAAVRRARKAMA